MADFGWRDGFTQLGSWSSRAGLHFIYVKTSHRDAPEAGSLWAWIVAGGPMTKVRMIERYEPSIVNNLPGRTMAGPGVACAFPSIEADALVAAGIAVYA